MPLGDVASGCVEVVLRFIFEALFQGLGELLWVFCQGTGSVLVWLLTLGRVWLSDRHEIMAGLIGIAFYIAVLAWAIPFFLPYAVTPRSTQPP